jgi:hypothetical protein
MAAPGNRSWSGCTGRVDNVADTPLVPVRRPDTGAPAVIPPDRTRLPAVPVEADCTDVPVVVDAIRRPVVPVTTIGPSAPDEMAIVVGRRAPEGVTFVAETAVAPVGSAACNPVFDVTPPSLARQSSRKRVFSSRWTRPESVG